MPQIRSKNSKVKHGLSASTTPRLRRVPTEEANIPLWQPDGTLRYVTRDDLKWLVDNKQVDMPIPPKATPKADNPPSSE